ncbi:unnamed protein product [Diamesa hyperborea]
MFLKMNLLVLIVVATAVVVTNCSPIDFLNAVAGNDPIERKLLARLADYLSQEYEDDSESDSATSVPVNSRGATGKAERCVLPMRRGLCRALLPRWRYDPISKTCIEFKFGGCDGNANNYKTQADCMEDCTGI